MAWTRPKPRLDAENRAYWTGGERGALLIVKCADCGEFTHPPREICRHCQSENVAPTAVPGTGAVETFSVNHQPWAPGMEVPFVIARVRLDGVPGVYLTTNIVGCPVDAVDVDDPVRVIFEQQDEVWFPLFEKVAR